MSWVAREWAKLSPKEKAELRWIEEIYGSPKRIMSELRIDEMICPECGGIAVSDSVDIGVGILVRGNFYCANCGWAMPMEEEPNNIIDLDEAFK